MVARAYFKLLESIRSSEASPECVSDIARRHYRIGDASAVTKNQVNMVHRYLRQLEADGFVVRLEPLPGQGRALLRYYKCDPRVNDMFMTHEAALSILLLRSHLGRFGDARALGNQALIDTAKSKLASNPPAKNRAARVRIVQDGLARQLADIDAALLDNVLEAIGQDQMIKITHKLVKGTVEEYALSIGGLVVKDGTAYIIGFELGADWPLHIPMHRIKGWERMKNSSVLPKDFSLDGHLEVTHQLCHAFDPKQGTIELHLMVHRAGRYHLDERPFLWGQSFGEQEGDWIHVTARVRNGVQLVPWILSMGPWFKIVSPAVVRDEVAARVDRMARLYTEGVDPRTLELSAGSHRESQGRFPR